ncbi:MAG TPA: ATP-binding cassette domain-containing protein [Sedimenticola thiotaurini]|uniref:ATP-binding cassette domain-containing protein n=1 Tax=Sedimenticola thiotaurini TaxID=1543721 RepID=A0A831RLM1_9GAMM|nr:ATP-binding cassette domain-containing protein [Sedimenticola thiotaurini]
METHSTPAAPLLRAENLGKRVQGPEGPLVILQGVTMELRHGEAVAILGASGSGKSTLLGLLAGLDSPSTGETWLFGTALGGLDEDGRAALRAGRVGFVFQSFQLLTSMTALENVMLPLELAGVADPRKAAEATLAEIGLGQRLHHYPAQLSGGEQQRVAIARAFAPRPALLFADEPTGSLDQATGRRISELLFRMRESSGATLLLVTHDPGLAAACDRRLQLDQGRLVPPS